MRQRASLVLAVLATAGLGTAGVAFGEDTKIDLTIKTVSETKSQYKGELKSDIPACVADRLIKVKSRDNRLVKTRSDDDGKFNENGKRPKSGAPLKLKVVETDECREIIKTGTAE
jgi:hypothetical protein